METVDFFPVLIFFFFFFFMSLLSPARVAEDKGVAEGGGGVCTQKNHMPFCRF